MRRKPWRAGYGMPLAQDHLTESWGEKKGTLGSAEGILAGRISSYEAGQQRESTKEKQGLIKVSLRKEELERGPWISVL